MFEQRLNTDSFVCLLLPAWAASIFKVRVCGRLASSRNVIALHHPPLSSSRPRGVAGQQVQAALGREGGGEEPGQFGRGGCVGVKVCRVWSAHLSRGRWAVCLLLRASVKFDDSGKMEGDLVDESSLTGREAVASLSGGYGRG